MDGLSCVCICEPSNGPVCLALTLNLEKSLLRSVLHSRKTDEKSKDPAGCEKSFIQYDEYFLSLARHQTEMENNSNIPVTEL